MRKRTKRSEEEEMSGGRQEKKLEEECVNMPVCEEGEERHAHHQPGKQTHTREPSLGKERRRTWKGNGEQ